jgi:hypothetical protein
MRTSSLSACVAFACLFGLLETGSAFAARDPTPTERAALTQAVFDVLPSVATKASIPGTRISSIKISTKSAKIASGARFYYRSFAVVDIYNPTVGGAAMLFGYYVSGVPGWRLLNGPGSSDVGCDISGTVFLGYKTAVMKDLGLSCH